MLETNRQGSIGSGLDFLDRRESDTSCFVATGALDEQDAEIRKAKRMKVPIVRENYLFDCVERKKKLPVVLYRVEAASEASNMATIKVRGRSSVHEMNGSAFSSNPRRLTVEEKKGHLEIARNSLELLSTILNSGAEPNLLKVNLPKLKECSMNFYFYVFVLVYWYLLLTDRCLYKHMPEM